MTSTRRMMMRVSDALVHKIGANDTERKKMALELLERVSLPAQAFDRYPHEFSGGQRQRIVIAIAMVCNPDILIADEPTTALDVTMQAQILDLMKELQQKIETSIIFITHDLGVVANVADRVAVMYGGQMIETGHVDEIFYDPNCRKVLVYISHLYSQSDTIIK